MTQNAPIFNVIIDANGVVMKRIEPGRPGYRKASKEVILRQRDAIERYQKLRTDNSFQGSYSFQFLDSAKTFAMLSLQEMKGKIEHNLSQIQFYDGCAKSSQR